jgi:hypothetical protein
VIGGGRFGRMAVDRIRRSIPGAQITVVDRKPIRLGEPVSAIRADGIQWLNEKLAPGAPVDMIVPAIPLHVASEWLKRNLSATHRIHPLDIPDAWRAQMPHPICGESGRVFVSHADFICPDNCPEPDNRCTRTGKPRPVDLFRLLATLDLGDTLRIVLRSHQLLPGVGGIYAVDLLAARQTLLRNHDRRIMVATACRCHGVADFFRLRTR